MFLNGRDAALENALTSLVTAAEMDYELQVWIRAALDHRGIRALRPR